MNSFVPKICSLEGSSLHYFLKVFLNKFEKCHMHTHTHTHTHSSTYNEHTRMQHTRHSYICYILKFLIIPAVKEYVKLISHRYFFLTDFHFFFQMWGMGFENCFFLIIRIKGEKHYYFIHSFKMKHFNRNLKLKMLACYYFRYWRFQWVTKRKDWVFGNFFLQRRSQESVMQYHLSTKINKIIIQNFPIIS